MKDNIARNPIYNGKIMGFNFLIFLSAIAVNSRSYHLTQGYAE
ncbi:MAG: hypothetical protein AAF693_18480 [Bacteroidota bacterium]